MKGTTPGTASAKEISPGVLESVVSAGREMNGNVLRPGEAFSFPREIQSNQRTVLNDLIGAIGGLVSLRGEPLGPQNTDMVRFNVVRRNLIVIQPTIDEENISGAKTQVPKPGDFVDRIDIVGHFHNVSRTYATVTLDLSGALIDVVEHSGDRQQPAVAVLEPLGDHSSLRIGKPESGASVSAADVPKPVMLFYFRGCRPADPDFARAAALTVLG